MVFILCPVRFGLNGGIRSTREVFDGPPDCSENHGTFFLAINSATVNEPGFWNGLHWDSLVAMFPANETEEIVLVLTQSSRFYVNGDLFDDE